MWPDSENRSNQIQECLDRRIDWSLFLKVVHRHRIAGLANHALPRTATDRIPSAITLALKDHAEILARQSLRAAGEASRLVTILQSEGIPCLILKGAPLAMLAYGNLGVRHSKDTDLLVSPADIFRADDALCIAGYLRSMPASFEDKKLLHAYMKNRSEFEYIQEKSGLQIDLHSRLNNISAFGPFFDLKNMQQHWQEVDLGGGLRVPTLGEDDLLGYLCSHGARHVWFRLKWLADVGALLAKSPAAGSRLLETSRQHKTERIAIQALLLCHTFWNTPLPEQMQVPKWVSRGLVKTACSAMTVGDASTEPNERTLGIVSIRLLSYFYIFYNSPRSLRDIFLNEVYFPTDMERLPARIRFLYPLLRLPLFMTRHTRLPKSSQP
jgi:hypothetical protein